MKEYKYLKTLFSVGDENVKILEKTKILIEKEAIKWFESFGFSFGKRTGMAGINQKNAKPGWYYTGGILIFDFVQLGGWYYPFIIKMYYFCNLKPREFKEGYKYGLGFRNSTREMYVNGEKGRDANPYITFNFQNNAWDLGFMLAVSSRLTPYKFLKIFEN